MRISDWRSYVCSSDLSLFAVNPLDFGHERLEHPVASPAADLVDNFDQQVDQPVCEFAFTVRQEKPEQRVASAIRVPAHRPGGLVDHSAAQNPRNGISHIRQSLQDRMSSE